MRKSGAKLVLGRDFCTVADDYWTWSVRAGRFLRLTHAGAVIGADVCLVEAARSIGRQPFRVAINVPYVGDVVAGMQAYLEAFGQHGGDELLRRWSA